MQALGWSITGTVMVAIGIGWMAHGNPEAAGVHLVAGVLMHILAEMKDFREDQQRKKGPSDAD